MGQTGKKIKMAKPLDFKDFLAVDYMPGEDGIIKKAAKKRKQDKNESVKETTCNCGPDCECNGECNENCNCGPECNNVDEALDMVQRRKRARQMLKYKSKIKIGRERAARRIASSPKLKKRARKKAREAMLKKITRDIPKGELTYARRQEIEKRLDQPAAKAKIERLAKKLFPQVRKDEMAKKRAR